MNSKGNLVRFSISALAIALILVCNLTAKAQTQAFTYQGKLNDSAAQQPANGVYNMTFRLFDAALGGNQIPNNTTAINSLVTVANGVFSARLDFGANAFAAAQPRYLEIEINSIILAPRQEITSAPFANRAVNATAADSLSNACVGCVTDAQINSVDGAKITGTINNATVTNAVNASNLTTTLPISQGGTGSTTQNFVDLTTSQNIAGNKTFGSGITLNDSFLRMRQSNDGNHGLLWSSAVDGIEFRGNLGFRWMTGTNGVNERMRLDAAGNLSAAGSVNTASQFNIGGNRVLSIPGNNNTFLGINTGNANTTGFSNSFFGLNAGLRNIDGAGNVFIGVSSGNANTSGQNNTFVGLDAGHENTTAGSNTFIGASAGFNTITGGANTFVGQSAGFTNSSGDSNTFIGTSSGFANTTGNSNFFGGFNSGRANTIGTQNVFLGRAAGFNNTEGGNNVFIGRSAGFTNTTGNSNTFIGTSAGATSSGAGNVMMGYNTGFSLADGDNNVFIGTAAGIYGTSNSSNTFVGAGAGATASGTSLNTFLGANADATGTITNATAVGANVIVSRSNSVVLGNNANVGVGTGSPAAKLQVNGGDIYVGNIGQGVILRSPNGSCFRLTVSNTGTLVATNVACPQ